MAESDIDTSGLSVASRIRMYQNNACDRSLQKPFVQKSSAGRSSSPVGLGSKFAPVDHNRSPNISPRTSPKSTSKVVHSPSHRLDQSGLVPKPFPRVQHKTTELSPSSGMVNVDKDSKDRASSPKPPLPDKPHFMTRSNISSHVNGTCNEQPSDPKVTSTTQNGKEPLVNRLSSEKPVESRRPSNGSDSSWKRLSGPPLRPLPPAPRAQSDQDLEKSNSDKQKELVPQPRPRCRSRQDVYEEVLLEENEGLPNETDETNTDYEEPNSPAMPQEFVPSENLQNKSRKVLSRISTSRRPPPLPNLSADSQKKSVKPPPLPSRTVLHTAEEQSVYSYASDANDIFGHRAPPSTQPVAQDSSYETPDVISVRGLMLGLQNQTDTYEMPDANCVNEFIASVRTDATDGSDLYEEPVQSRGMSTIAGCSRADSDSDSEAYCDPETLPTSPRHRIEPKFPLAPQKSLPPPPSNEGSETEDSEEDSNNEYEDPTDEIRPSAKVLSLRRGSQPVLNPDAYLTLKDMELDSTYQDPAEAFRSSRAPFGELPPTPEEAVYEGLEDEPLYQVYAADVLSEMRRKSEKSYQGDEDVFSEYSTGGIEAGQRILWCHLPSVRNSGVLQNLEPRERKRQEAMFEVLTSEASYLKSLNILVNYFMNEFLESSHGEEKIIDKQQFHFLFGGLPMIKSVSEKFLHSLRGRQEESFIISSISDLVHNYASTQFECYVKYCSNQVYQERTLTRLVSENQTFCDLLGKLESSPKSQGLSLQSFLMLPMQRITRLPLLMDAICHHCEPGSEEFNKTDEALTAVHKVVKACNEGARKMERIEEMYFVQQMLTFKMKPIPIVSSSRWLLRRGELTCLEGERKMRGLKTLLRGGKYYRIYLFLFNDLLLVTKMKGEDSFKVFDYCSRALLRIDDDSTPTGDTLKQGGVGIPSNKYMFSLILLENHQGKTATYVCFAENETEKVRWMDAVNPKSSTNENTGEKVYEEWDCPQVRAIHSYQAEQPDELTLREGDVIKVLRKLPDGWYEGMQLIDGETGWFPANHSEEILSEHTRARNLMQRYRLINTVTLAFDTRSKRL